MSEDIPKTEKILSIEEIQRMFEEMGLGTEEERRRFQPEPEHLPIESPKPERWPTLSNHTRKLQLESPNGELERSPQHPAHVWQHP
jgi:hypothetical protein